MELYDMDLDPKQYNNLAQNPHYISIVEQMQGRLRQKLKEVRNNDLGIDYK